MNYLYLCLDLLAISVPLVASFYKKAPFYKTWKSLFWAILIPGTIFITWDVYFTSRGIWGFNHNYLLGIDIINLPIEEWLFFICIPYACVFTYFSLNVLIKKDYFKPIEKYITWCLIIGLALVGLLNLDKWYTSVTFISLSLFLLYHVFILKSTYRSKFYFAFIFILLPFFLINGVLTGTGIENQVVWYNNAENLGIRMGTIPFEDTFYGMLLLFMNVTIYESLRSD